MAWIKGRLSRHIRRAVAAMFDKAKHFIDGDGTQLPLRYPHYAIGRGSYGWPQVIDSGEGASLKIGAFCSIAKGVQILLGGEHHTEWISTYPFSVFYPAARTIPGHPKTKGDVVIGNDVWIGQNATILSGVTIGDGAVIGACALVASDVAPYTIVAGNPARIIRKRFPDDVIARLLALAWWSWPTDEIERLLPVLLSEDVDTLLQYGVSRSSPTS